MIDFGFELHRGRIPRVHVGGRCSAVMSIGGPSELVHIALYERLCACDMIWAESPSEGLHYRLFSRVSKRSYPRIKYFRTILMAVFQPRNNLAGQFSKQVKRT